MTWEGCGKWGTAWTWQVSAGLCLLCPQEEESPCGEVTLKRDRSFSEHDLAQLRSEVASGPQLAGGVEPSRPRVGSEHSWRPHSRDQGKCWPQSHSLPCISLELWLYLGCCPHLLWDHPLSPLSTCSPPQRACALPPDSHPGSVQSPPDASFLRFSVLGPDDRPEASTAPDSKHLWLVSSGQGDQGLRAAAGDQACLSSAQEAGKAGLCQPCCGMLDLADRGWDLALRM